MPSFTMIAPRGGHTVHGHFWVPIDDENCWTWSYDYHPTRAITDGGARGDEGRQGRALQISPGTYRPLANKDNDYLMDREAQKRGDSYQRHRGHRDPGRLAAGKHGSDHRSHQGKLGVHRQRHHHGALSPDARGQGSAEKGSVPPGVDVAHQRVRSAAVVLPPDRPFKDAAKEQLRVREGVAPASV